MNSQEHRALSTEYDAKYTSFRASLSKTTPLSGDTSGERLKSHNWARWCFLAGHATQFCKYCGWPLEPTSPGAAFCSTPEERCALCAEMEVTLFKRSYWNDLRFKRS